MNANASSSSNPDVIARTSRTSPKARFRGLVRYDAATDEELAGAKAQETNA